MRLDYLGSRFSSLSMEWKVPRRYKDTTLPQFPFHPETQAVSVTAHLPESLWVQLNFLLCNLKSHIQLFLAGDCWELPWATAGPPAFDTSVGSPAGWGQCWFLRILTQASHFSSVIFSKSGWLLTIWPIFTYRSEPIVFSFSSHALCSFTSVILSYSLCHHSL